MARRLISEASGLSLRESCFSDESNSWSNNMIHPIPVVLGQPRPGTPDNFTGRSPVTMVHVGCDETLSPRPGHLPAHNGKTYSALIDTGAEGSAIDKSIASEIGATLKHDGIIIHSMGASQTGVSRCDIQIIFPTVGAVFAEPSAVVDFHSSGNTFDLILGRSFLNLCSLYFYPRSQIYQLNWIDEPH